MSRFRSNGTLKSPFFLFALSLGFIFTITTLRNDVSFSRTETVLYKQDVVSNNRFEVVSNANVGRDGNVLWLQHRWYAHAGSHHQDSGDRLLLRLDRPHPACEMDCLYRFAVEGPIKFGGYLSDLDHNGSLGAELVLTHGGNYSAVVYLESLGLNATKRLPWNLSSIPETEAELAINFTKYEVTFVGIEISNQSVTLPVTLPSKNGSKEEKTMPPLTLCTYRANPALPYGNFGWEVRPSDGAPLSVSADNCQLQRTTRADLERSVEKYHQRYGDGVDLLFMGTSRIEHLVKHMNESMFGGKIPKHTTMSKEITEDDALKAVDSVLKALCNNTNSTGLLILSVSFGIWEVRDGWHRTKDISPVDFAKKMQARARKISETIQRICSDRPYRVLWVAEPPTQPWILGTMQPWNNGRIKREEKYQHYGWNSTHPEIIISTFFGGLSVATPHLMLTNEEFRCIAYENGHGYVPLDLLYLPGLPHGSDHIHQWAGPARQLGSEMLLSAVIQEIDMFLMHQR